MIDDDRVARGKRIQRQTGATFHVATRLLPERIRYPTYVLYGFFRVADEIVDAADTAPPAEQRAEIERIRRIVLGEEPPGEDPDDEVLAAFRDLRTETGIARTDVAVFLEAMASDVDRSRYETYADLEAYMDGSAAAVGRMMTAVMDVEDPERALPHATTLGEAFQMTNFLRDVGEDVRERDRVYLPAETLREHGASVDQIRERHFDESVAAAIRAELARTEDLYAEGVAGIRYLPADCQLAVLLAAVLYADHHRLIRDLDYDTLSQTPELSIARRLRLLARTWWLFRRYDDPETVFYAAIDSFDVEAPARTTHTHSWRDCQLMSYLSR
ncbi:phytoene/squalene synthase family protein [Halopenitus sp. POP-27]|uniref:phytoene/squalene synthase family protein n=1 Tax=Halopenitus sp. POP-27 TaxID=2994425 RepID=UPI00246940EA|nr:phytoene/squalene synthase family protein [Halopenitus sp. POP-27]